MTDPTDQPREPSDRRATRSGRRDEILDVAERLARRGGYHGFSFRDVATEVGVKSASIHYYFRTKPDLGIALVTRYGARFVERLGPPGEAGALLGLIAAFRSAIQEEGGVCLCGLFGAEASALPDPLRETVAGFFGEIVGWTETALAAADGAGVEAQGRRDRAEALVAGLEGAVILARATADPGVYDRTAARLLDAARGARWSGATPAPLS